MTITEAMRQALEQTQRINRLKTELVLAHSARAKALEVVAPALAVQGQSESLDLTAPFAPGDVVFAGMAEEQVGASNGAALDQNAQINDG